jgi:predicted esterase
MTIGSAPTLGQEPEQPAPAAPEKPKPLYSEEQLQKIRDLMQKGQSAIEMDDHEAGCKAFEEVLAVAKTGPLASNGAYNAACCHSLCGRKDKAISLLEKAIELGFRDMDHIERDKDFASIRDSAEFKAVLAKMLWNDEVAIYVPKGVDDNVPLPVLLALHVDGRTEAKVLEYMKPLADEMKVLLVAPRAPFMHPGPFRPGQEPGYAWKRGSTDDKPAVKKVHQALEKAAKIHAFDAEKITIIGVGGRAGYLAYLMSFTEPTRYRRTVVLGGFFNKYYFPDFFPKALAENKGIWIFHSSEIPQFPNAKAASEILTKAGFGVTFTEYKVMDHKSARPTQDQLAPMRKALTW